MVSERLIRGRNQLAGDAEQAAVGLRVAEGAEQVAVAEQAVEVEVDAAVVAVEDAVVAEVIEFFPRSRFGFLFGILFSFNAQGRY